MLYAQFAWSTERRSPSPPPKKGSPSKKVCSPSPPPKKASPPRFEGCRGVVPRQRFGQAAIDLLPLYAGQATFRAIQRPQGWRNGNDYLPMDIVELSSDHLIEVRLIILLLNMVDGHPVFWHPNHYSFAHPNGSWPCFWQNKPLLLKDVKFQKVHGLTSAYRPLFVRDTTFANGEQARGKSSYRYVPSLWQSFGRETSKQPFFSIKLHLEVHDSHYSWLPM